MKLRNKTRALCLALLLAAGLSACAGKAPALPGKSELPDGSAASSLPGRSGKSRAQSILGRMTPEEKVGQMLFVGFSGKEAKGDVGAMVTEHHVGGILFFGENVGTVSELLALQNSFRALNEEGVPLFFGVDEEGGRVSRLPDGVFKLPAPKLLGERGDAKLAEAAGAGLARQLKRLGYNVDFAPDADIPLSWTAGAIGDRGYGQSAALVSKMSAGFLKGMETEGMITAVKHFPGHGNTVTDSHKAMPVVESTMEELWAKDLVPFQEAVEGGTPMVMVGHILVPAIDPEHGASTSRKMITGLLREQLGFRGVVLTDELSMSGLTKQYSVPEAALLAVRAGADILLIAGDTQNQKDALEAILAALKEGTLSEERINESVLRILELKEAYGLTNAAVAASTAAEINAEMNEFNLLWNQ